MASSSGSFKYDVFLSFRGEDIRKTFVDHLHSALKQHLIRIYKDDETLPQGESINQSLIEAIEESQIAVVILSKNYADSSWCLDELAHIMKCKDERELIVIPIFYDVEPTDVRNQKRRFGKAFSKQEAKNATTKAEIWRKALVGVSNISGWELKNIANGHESQFIKKIVDAILDRLFALHTCVDEDLVGMRARFRDLESLLDIGSGGVCMVGIWGVGGGGKTTLATSFYMEISQQFQGRCIVENVREETRKHGLNKLQENILTTLFQTKVEVHSVVEGKHMMKSMLRRRKVLVLLDDVDKVEQLEALAGKHNWFGSGSRIIITTRDEHVLKTHKVDHIYPITLLSDDEAARLFKRHSYNEKEILVEDYETLSLRVVSYARGLPLALKVLGSFLYDKGTSEWICVLEKLKEIPDSKVMDILRISYDGLEPYEKELYLDITCFFRRLNVNYVIEMLEACGYYPRIGIKVLIQKALLSIDKYGRIDMHDLVQEMGRYIVKGEHPKNPEKHSRVWELEDIKNMSFHDETKEYDEIKSIIVYDESVPTNILADDACKIVSKMKKLRLLIVDVRDYGVSGANFLSNELRYIEWVRHPPSPFPQHFRPTELVVLKVIDSMQKELWTDDKHLPNLKVLHLQGMFELLRTPDFNGLPRLQKLVLKKCYKLVEIHPSFGNLTSLEHLEVTQPYKLKRLPTISQMKNIKVLQLRYLYTEDGELTPCGIGELSNLQELILRHNRFSRLDFSLLQLTRLQVLDLTYCDKLIELPELPSNLVIVKADKCKSVTTIGDSTKNCERLCEVSLIGGWNEDRLCHISLKDDGLLLQSMLKGKAIKNGCLYLRLEGLEIPNAFTPPLRRGCICSLELPENWCNDFSGFLLCAVFPMHVYLDHSDVMITMNDTISIDSEDDMVWEQSTYNDKYTWVGYVSFGSLRHTSWWDQTYKALEFIFAGRCSGFGVRLVDRKSRRCLTETSPDSSSSSSHYTPKIIIRHDSASSLTICLNPYKYTLD